MAQARSAHLDTFCRDGLPPRDQWPDLTCHDPGLAYPEVLNLGEVLLEGTIAVHGPDRPALLSADRTWTYAEVRHKASQIAETLTDELGVIPGNRIMILGPNEPWFAMIWLAVLRAGCVAVPVSPLLTGPELSRQQAATGASLLIAAADLHAQRSRDLPKIPTVTYGGDAERDLISLAEERTGVRAAVPTAQDDVAFLVSTSGTTGTPKVTAHFHRDLLYIADAWSGRVFHTQPDDVFAGTPHLSFTYGLCSRLAVPLRHGASTVLDREASAHELLDSIERYAATVCISSPTAYRVFASLKASQQLRSVRVTASSGEALPPSTFEAFKAVTGLEIMEALGTTECTSTFTSSAPGEIKPGSVGKPLSAYRVEILDDDGNPVPVGRSGWLAVQGPTGCRYLNDERQANYVRDGWNITGDIFRYDQDGYLWYSGRSDDLINSGGHKFYPAEIEDIVLQSPLVRECVITSTHIAGTDIVNASIVLSDDTEHTSAVADIRQFLMERLAAYKIPRTIKIVDSIPRTVTGKLRR